jgi:ribose-phosphate pyrophosphokinase
VTAVVPYSGYARQDRRSRAGEPVGTRVISDALVTAGAQRRDLLVHPATEQLSALPLSVLFVTDSVVQKEARTLPVRVPSTCAATCRRGLSAASRPGAG